MDLTVSRLYWRTCIQIRHEFYVTCKERCTSFLSITVCSVTALIFWFLFSQILCILGDFLFFLFQMEQDSQSMIMR